MVGKNVTSQGFFKKNLNVCVGREISCVPMAAPKNIHGYLLFMHKQSTQEHISIIDLLAQLFTMESLE